MTAPSEMLERAAKAGGRAADHALNEENRIAVARAVLEAIREPTEEMQFAGARKLPDYDPSSDDARECWWAMIDQILGSGA